jgi:hypothetical protein
MTWHKANTLVYKFVERQASRCSQVCVCVCVCVCACACVRAGVCARALRVMINWARIFHLQCSGFQGELLSITMLLSLFLPSTFFSSTLHPFLSFTFSFPFRPCSSSFFSYFIPSRIRPHQFLFSNTCISSLSLTISHTAFLSVFICSVPSVTGRSNQIKLYETSRAGHDYTK